MTPVRLLCAACDGAGCGECNAGWVEVTECFQKSITPDVWQALDAAEELRHGLPPVAGGMLDQAAVFLEAVRFVEAQRAYWRGRVMREAMDNA